MPTETLPPLLNGYKYGLAARRALQTFTGGLKLQKVPCYLHIIQVISWFLPLLISTPFHGVVFVWNSPYYLGIAYGVLSSVVVFLLNVIVWWVLRKNKDEIDTGDEEEEEEIISSCWSIQTVKFLFHQSRPIIAIPFHGLFSGLLCYAAFLLLNPFTLRSILPIPAVVVVFILGWVSVCSAHYSLLLHLPHEVAIHRPPHRDRLLLRYISRPFHIILIAALFVPFSIQVSSPILYVLYSVLCLLTLVWSVGVAPPIDALLSYLMEQTLVHLLGGSPMASETRLCFMFVLSSISTIIVAVIASRPIAVILAAVFGLLLSHDIPLMLLTVAAVLYKLLPSRLMSSKLTLTHPLSFSSLTMMTLMSASTRTMLVIRVVLLLAKVVAMLAASVVIVYYTFQYTGDIELLLINVFAGVLVTAYCIILVLDSMQPLYCCAGLLRGPIHPRHSTSVDKFTAHRQCLTWSTLPRRAAVTIILPLFMVTFAGLSLETSATTGLNPVWFAITSTRMLRKIWQSTNDALLELVLVAVLTLLVPPDSSWVALGLGTQALIVGLCVTTLTNAWNRLHFLLLLFYNYIAVPDLRTRKNIATLALVFLLLPISLMSIAVTSVLSSPLFPIFTLPILLPSFPRMRAFWPRLVHTSAVTEPNEAVFYQQMEKEVVKAIFQSLSSGVMRHFHAGTYLLVRFQDRLMFVSISEEGYGYVTMQVKGLELQETSCHTTEASRVDEMIEACHSTQRKSCDYWFNTYPVNSALHIVDSQVIHTYSDARNTLTGIIDQHEYLSRFSANLMKTLTWTILHHLVKELQTSKDSVVERASSNQRTSEHVNSIQGQHSVESIPVHESMQEEEDTFSWSHSVTSLEEIPSKVQTVSANKPTTSRIAAHRMIHHSSSFSIPTDTIPSTVAPSQITLQQVTSASSGIRTNKVTPIHVSSSSSVLQSVSTIPVTSSQLAKVSAQLNLQWFDHIVQSITPNHSSNSTIIDPIKSLIAACYLVTDTPTGGQAIASGIAHHTRPGTLWSSYQGEFPCPYELLHVLNWMKSNKTLFKLVLKAYRYAVKLMYDEAVLGEVSDNEELIEYLTEYDTEWYIGCEGDQEWRASILNETPHLFSMGAEKERGSYTARVLSLQDEVVHIGALNSAVVDGVWCNLAWELQYLTNDDDERYSIQAHPSLLRNLLTQTADSPLGYHVYSSTLLSIPRF